LFQNSNSLNSLFTFESHYGLVKGPTKYEIWNWPQDRTEIFKSRADPWSLASLVVRICCNWNDIDENLKLFRTKRHKLKIWILYECKKHHFDYPYESDNIKRSKAFILIQTPCQLFWLFILTGNISCIPMLTKHRHRQLTRKNYRIWEQQWDRLYSKQMESSIQWVSLPRINLFSYFLTFVTWCNKA
jgi:hypothetical protein